jgi:hypothetical protein
MQVGIGSTVRVASILSATQTQIFYATVLAVAPRTKELDGPDGEPTLSIVYVDPNADMSEVGTSSWRNVLKREVNVAHASHEAVTSGQRGIYWIDEVPGAAVIHPLPEGMPKLTTGVSAVFSREHAEEFFNRDAQTVPKKVEPVTETKPTTEPHTPAVGSDAAPVTPAEPASATEKQPEPAPAHTESATDSTTQPTAPTA